MGTNYYLRSLPCKECGHCKIEQHIGKSSMGWEFHFRGYRVDNIMSYQDWLWEISNLKRAIYNEENELISPHDFVKLVESKKGGLNHFNITTNQPETSKEENYLQERTGYGTSDDYNRLCWKDPEGYAFTDWPFS